MFNVAHNYSCLFGEVVELDFECVVHYVLNVNGLRKIAQKSSIELGFSVDTGPSTSNTSHIYGGCKNFYCHSTNKNGNLMYVDKEEDGIISYKNLQSNANVYLTIIGYAKDSMTPYSDF